MLTSIASIYKEPDAIGEEFWQKRCTVVRSVACEGELLVDLRAAGFKFA
jgi:hypothetical protein